MLKGSFSSHTGQAPGKRLNVNDTHKMGSFLNNDLKVTFVGAASLKEIPAKAVIRLENYDCWEIVVCQRGSLEITSRGKTFTLKEGQLVFRFPGASFEISTPSDKGSLAGVLGFEAENMPMELITEDTIFQLSPADLREYASIILFIRDAFEMDEDRIVRPKEGTANDLKVLKPRLEMFLASVLYITEKAPHNSPKTVDYMTIIHYLSENVNRDLTINDIASELNRSPTSVKKIFSRYAGIGIMHYFNLLKVNRALDLLNEGYSVGYVSEMLSFSSPSAFSTAFKNLTGVSPSHFRDIKSHPFLKSESVSEFGKRNFGIGETVRREEVITFLWRMAGCPEPQTDYMPFKDINPDFYYYKAVQWAAENNITKGYLNSSGGERSFGPGDPCLFWQFKSFVSKYEALEQTKKNSDDQSV